MEAAIRDAPFGQLVRYLTKNKYFKYPEEQPDFHLPDAWLHLLNESSASTIGDEKVSPQDTKESSEPLSRTSTQTSLTATDIRLQLEEQHEIEKTKSIPITPKKTKDGAILVDWYYTDDSENPHNWTNRKRALIATIICLYTFVVYLSLIHI